MPAAGKRTQRAKGAAPYAKPYACPHCAATFGHASSLNKHVRTVHEQRRDYKCPHCPAAFGRANNRARHMHSKHPNDNAQAAECPICLEVLADVDEKATTPCGHVFCRACIEAALPRSGECPSCTQACSAAQLR